MMNPRFLERDDGRKEDEKLIMTGWFLRPCVYCWVSCITNAFFLVEEEGVVERQYLQAAYQSMSNIQPRAL